MKFALHTSTAISSVLKEPEHFYVDIYARNRTWCGGGQGRA